MKRSVLAVSAVFAAALLIPSAASAFGRGGGGGGHFGGGGGMHFGGGGGGMHFGGGGGGFHFGGAHFGGLHFGGAHFGGIHHFGGAHFAHVAPHFGAGHLASSRIGEAEHRNELAGRGNERSDIVRNLREGRVADARAALAPHRMLFGNEGGRFDRKGFGHFAARGAPFHSWHHWHRFPGFYGWAGPLFWPYAYDDIFDDLFWAGPYYYDPFWDYGYGDLYGAIFSPFGYRELAGYLPGGGSVPGARVGGSEVQGMCGSDRRDIVGWPIQRIQQLLRPTPEQQALLDELGNASVRAAQIIRTACSTTAALTPSGRLAAMRMRIEAMIEAVNTIRMPLDQFYDSLNDEQKARFVAESRNTQGATTTPSADCAAVNVAAQWPQDEIEHTLHPNQDQQAKLTALKDAAAKASDVIAKACPAQMPMTPTGRLEAIANRLNALLDAVKVVQAPLNDFYSSLSDEQKAQFNVIGQSQTVRR